jgi:hypothetical protein
VWRELLELRGDLIQSQTDSLREDKERDPAEHCSMIPSLAATGPV